MIITKEKLIKFLDDNKINELNVNIELTTEFLEQVEGFVNDQHKLFSNERKYCNYYDKLTMTLVTYTNHGNSFIGFSR